MWSRRISIRRFLKKLSDDEAGHPTVTHTLYTEAARDPAIDVTEREQLDETFLVDLSTEIDTGGENGGFHIFG